MAQNVIRLSIPLDCLAQAFAGLTLREKYQLLAILETQIAEAEEETWEKDASVRHEIHEAHTAYQTGDFMPIDEYVIYCGCEENRSFSTEYQAEAKLRFSFRA